MNPFLRPDSASDADMLTDGALAVLAESGLGGLSISAIARWAGVTPPALTVRWREENRGARERILGLVIVTFGKRWHLWSRRALMEAEPSLSLPSTAEEVAGVRAWLALRELARSEERAGNSDLVAAVARIEALDRSEVRDHVRTAEGRPLAADAAAAVCALADGLRTALVSSDPGITFGAAQAVLRAYVAGLRREGPPRSTH